VIRHNLGHSNFHAHHINLPDFHGLNLVIFFKWKISGFEKKNMFFESTNFSIQKFKIHIFCFISIEIVKNYGVAWIGLNYYDYQDFYSKFGVRKHLPHSVYKI
jgi:hypothetical protein